MSNEADFYLSEGDTSDPLEVRLKHDDGSVVDLTGASVRFQMSRIGDDLLKVDSNPVSEGSSGATDGTGIDIDDATNGDVTYHWSGDDTGTAGYFNARFQVDYSGAVGSNFDVDQSFPNENYLTVKIDEGL